MTDGDGEYDSRCVGSFRSDGVGEDFMLCRLYSVCPTIAEGNNDPQSVDKMQRRDEPVGRSDLTHRQRTTIDFLDLYTCTYRPNFDYPYSIRPLATLEGLHWAMCEPRSST